MMTKKRMALIAVLPLTVAVIFGVVAILEPDARLGDTKANFDRVKKGMTVADVSAILGLPHGCAQEINRAREHRAGEKDWEGRASAVYPGDDGFGVVEFSFDMTKEAVISKKWIRSEETMLEKIRRWLHLSKGK
jgi:hypothetical protein